MTTATQLVQVRLGERSYAIEIGADTLASLGRFLTALHPTSRAIIITDDRVEQPHADVAANSLAAAGTAVDVLVVPSGERNKSIDSAAVLWEKLLHLGADRKTVIVAVGGGVVGDLAGFVAATFARGLPLVQVPTTLLAQVDSSVGGKVGVNLPGAKNMVGAFWQPLGVLIDIATLDTLPEREYRAGLAEVVKYGVILDAEFFEFLEAHVLGLVERQPDVLAHVVTRCCQLKADVVGADEREESGHRAVLNYGHTFCHALEAITDYGEWLHGEAVSIGMHCAARLAERLGRIDATLTDRQKKLLMGLGLPTALPRVDVEAFMAAMSRDKKTEQGRLRFVLPTRLGNVELVDNVDPAEVRASLTGE